MKKLLALVLAMVMALSLCVAMAEETYTFDITVWVAEEVKDLTAAQIAEFNANNEYGIVFNATIEAVSESEAATNMITDVEAGGDLFCFAQDQFARLVQAYALAKLSPEAAEVIEANNAAGVVSAAKSGDEMYAYPLTADNGYFMYYDKSVIPEEHIGSLEAIIADCEANDKFFSFEMNTSAWYAASFFFATGCHSDWETDADGNFISVNDDFKSDKGLIAVKGMKKLVDSPCFNSSSAGSAFASGSAVVVTGTWDYMTVSDILGDNMGVAELPSFEVDGVSYHLGSYNGCKLMGVKPQPEGMEDKAAALEILAEYLTGYECQMQRFNERAWGPSNLEAQASSDVQANPGLSALLAQSPSSIPQGQIHGSWWDIAKVIADDVKAAEDEDGLWLALSNYVEKIDALFDLDTSALLFVGAWNGWNNADDTDTFYLKDGTLTLDVPESDYMGGRIVNPGSWDTDKGFAQVVTGAELIKDLGADNPDNNIVFAEAGNYTVTLNGTEISIVKN